MFNKYSWLTNANEDPQEKIREHQKKIEYGNFLKEQIEEKKRRKELEKMKRLKEEEKYNKQYINEFYKNNNKVIYNSSFTPGPTPLQKEEHTPITTLSNSQIKNTTPIGNNVNQVSNGNARYNSQPLLQVANNMETISTPQVIQNTNINPNTNVSNTLPTIPPQMNMNLNGGFNYNGMNTINGSLENNRQIYFPQINNTIDVYFKDFVQEQINVINSYEQAIDGVILKSRRDNPYSLSNYINIEYNRALSKIRSEQNRLKETLGFFPLEENYNRKIEELFNKILNKKIAMFNSLQSNKESIYYDDINFEQGRRMKELEYKSKYENLKDTVPNFDELEREDKASLVGFSKLVKIDNRDDNFLETWRDNIIRQETQRREMGLQRYNTNDKVLNGDNKKSTESIKKVVSSKKVDQGTGTDDEDAFISEQKEKDNKERILIHKIEASHKEKQIEDNKDTKKENKKEEKKNEVKVERNVTKSQTQTQLQRIEKVSLEPSDEKVQNSTVSYQSNYYYKKNTDDIFRTKDNQKKKTSISEQCDNFTLNPDKIKDKKEKKEEKETSNENINQEDDDEESIQEMIEQSERKHTQKTFYHNIDNNLVKPNTDYRQRKPNSSHNNKRFPFTDSIRRFDDFYKEDDVEHNVMNDPNLPMGNGEEASPEKKTKKPITNHSPRNSKNVSQISDNDSILKDLDRFRQIALNDIGNLDNPNIVQQHAKNRTVDLIPKDVIRNYDKLISSGSRK